MTSDRIPFSERVSEASAQAGRTAANATSDPTALTGMQMSGAGMAWVQIPPASLAGSNERNNIRMPHSADDGNLLIKLGDELIV